MVQEVYVFFVLQVWDFNGHCHHCLDAGREQAVEISQLLVLNRSVLVMGWGRCVCVIVILILSVSDENVVCSLLVSTTVLSVNCVCVCVCEILWICCFSYYYLPSCIHLMIPSKGNNPRCQDM